MPVMRSTSTVGTETGESVSVLAENFSDAQSAFTIYDPDVTDKNGYFRVVRDHPDGNKVGLIGWGAGTRALFVTGTSGGLPTGRLTPVIALMPNPQNSRSSPQSATVIESAVDPILRYFPTTKRYVLFYWVNAWSPIPAGPLPAQPTLFQGVRPPDPIWVDQNYLFSNTYHGPRPQVRYTVVRDVPDWYPPSPSPPPPGTLDIAKLAISPMSSNQERVGPIDTHRFWIAPFTDAHLFRFPEGYDPFPPPPLQDPYVPPSPPGTGSPPLPPQTVTEPSADSLASFPFLTYPFNRTVRAVNSILFNVKNGITLRPIDWSTLDTYVYALNRLAGLARCTRVLMQTEGYAFLGRRRDDAEALVSGITPVLNPIGKEVDLYLVMNPPRPVLSLPRGINKVLLGKPKVTSYLGNSFFVTAALTYRYPAAATVSLCAGNPHVDFLLHCPSDRFDEYRRMGILPESVSPQHSPYDPGVTFVIPGAYGISLVEVLSTMAFW